MQQLLLVTKSRGSLVLGSWHPGRELCCVGLGRGTTGGGLPITVLSGLCMSWLGEKGEGPGYECTLIGRFTTSKGLSNGL